MPLQNKAETKNPCLAARANSQQLFNLRVWLTLRSIPNCNASHVHKHGTLMFSF